MKTKETKQTVNTGVNAPATITASEFRANLCAGMITDICKRLENYCGLAKEETSLKEREKIRAKARKDFNHLCECLKKVTPRQALELARIYRTTSDNYAKVFGI